MLRGRKGVFIPKHTVSRESIVRGQEYNITIHGAFQYQDGTEAGVILLAELDDGRLIEIGVGEVTLTKEETEDE